jgi:hypothetical protein
MTGDDPPAAACKQRQRRANRGRGQAHLHRNFVADSPRGQKPTKSLKEPSRPLRDPTGLMLDSTRSNQIRRKQRAGTVQIDGSWPSAFAPEPAPLLATNAARSALTASFAGIASGAGPGASLLTQLRGGSCCSDGGCHPRRRRTNLVELLHLAYPCSALE